MSSHERLDAVRRAFDARAATYDESRMHRSLAAAVAAYADLDGVVDVLDVATGTGLVLRALHDRAVDLRMTGADISTEMLDVARDAHPDAVWLEADAAALPVPDRSTDLITCVTALHAIPDTRSALAEWRRILRPEGRALTATFQEREPDRSMPGRSAYPSDHAPFSSIGRLERTAEDAGFRIERSTIWSDGYDRLIIAQWRPIGTDEGSRANSAAAVAQAPDGT
ncbi:class I SAM-dependent methyltransferase [Microbacterium sp. NPDC056234]|uniref:class I SAM-dependent methyltransferase n=1 Tax=Microbacterium sp. NPDC056234 TaxID=3345757 RepID=UPI0035E0505D